MNRRTSMLCLVLVAAAGLLLAAHSQAETVAFDVHNQGSVITVGWPSGYPVWEMYTTQQTVPKNDLHITKMAVYVKGNSLTGEVWDGRDVWLTDDGDALFARFVGNYWPDPNDPTGTTMLTELHQTFVGGTGRFAGARGTSTHHCQVFFDDLPSLVNVSNDCESQGELVLPHLKGEPVPMKAEEGELVSLELQHVEREAFGMPPLPFLVQKATHLGDATYIGPFSDSKLSLLNLDTMGFYGFFTATAADGGTIDGYYEGALSPRGRYADILGVRNLRVWMTGGTGEFENATGILSGSGTLSLDGTEDIRLGGKILSLGASND